MIAATVVEVLRQKYHMLKPELDERGRRLWAASESLVLGYGGLKAVVEATGLGENTVRRGCQELQATVGAPPAQVRRIRRQGGGRKPLTGADQELLTVLEGLVEPTARWEYHDSSRSNYSGSPGSGHLSNGNQSHRSTDAGIESPSCRLPWSGLELQHSPSAIRKTFYLLIYTS